MKKNSSNFSDNSSNIRLHNFVLNLEDMNYEKYFHFSVFPVLRIDGCAFLKIEQNKNVKSQRLSARRNNTLVKAVKELLIY